MLRLLDAQGCHPAKAEVVGLNLAKEMEENEEEDLRELDKMFAQIDGDGILSARAGGIRWLLSEISPVCNLR